MRRIQAPGIEINEIDRSQYNVKTDASLTDTATLIAGFADVGPDYETTYIENLNEYIQTYGYPTNEVERYFYYAAKEVLNKRGILYCAKLPYMNLAYKKFTYTDYKVGNKLVELSSVQQLINQPLLNTNIEVHSVLGDNGFLTTMKLVKLDKQCLNKIDQYYAADDFEYCMFDDFFEYVFFTSGEKTHIKSTYDKYFKKYAGLHYFNNLIQCQISGSIMSSDVVVDFGISSDYDVVDDLQNIAEDTINFFNSDKFSGPLDEAFDMFVKSKTIDEFKEYYDNFYQQLLPAYDKVLSGISPGQSSNYWKIDFANLSNYCDKVFSERYTEIRSIDDTLTSYIQISSLSSGSSTGKITFEQYDNLKIGKLKVPNSTIRIVDITRAKYKYNDDHDKEFLGVMPVITTAANALYYQDFIAKKTRYADYNVLSRVKTVSSDVASTDLTDDDYYDENNNMFLFSTPLKSNKYKSAVSDAACSYFPQLTYTASQHIDRNYMKQIGVVVFKLLKSATSNNKVTCTPVESFVGSLNRNDTDNIKGTNVFIDTLVNENSQYVNVFTNVQFDDTDKSGQVDKASMYMIHDQTATSLGFYNAEYDKQIHVKNSILESLDVIFKNNENIDRRSIDVVCDAGVSNIAQYIASTKQLSISDQKERCGYYDIVDADGRAKYSISTIKQTTIWRQVIAKYDNLCKYVRKDCMFIADGLRQTCLIGNEKIVRRTMPTNTIVKDIVPQLKYQLNLNTSYGAGYCNWFYMYDDYSGLYFWCPPSIKATGVYVYSDIYYNYWDAPAGLNRGVIQDVYGLAFNPTLEEAGYIYKNSWNYAMQYPLDGIVLEGQKTFQINHTAFDRVNVRRLFLKMEKLVYKIAKRFCYEGNTAYLRQRFVDTITPIFEEAKSGGGISEYVIICNESNNNVQTIENHELHCTIAVRPIKTIEFVVLNFIALPQSGSFTEEELLKMTPYYGQQ